MAHYSSNVLRELPYYRMLRGYAFDPSLSVAIDTADINTVLYKIRWEDSEGGPFGPGPVGEYLEVIDFDPTVGEKGICYSPVDLNDPYILANNGLPPSESNPQFHQQFVYSVAMLTIQHFELALGRRILWAPRLLADRSKYEEYVPRLRIYPHAIREANAFYSPLKKAILCGYFSASPKTIAVQMPNSLVFTCLSHDIVAHETTHAILDGLHRNYNRATNPDVLAFHEAFADIVALFQHFTFPEVLKHQIGKTRGDLDKQNLLGELAQQVGMAIGKYGSLRDAIGSHDKDSGEWTPSVPDPTAYQNTFEPHDRGSILVAAVFEAFLTMYKGRIKDLLRIASGGRGDLPRGELHPDLVNRLADEASKTASHVLSMCVRALDYCPPVDITFGDFLRALITADYDLVRDDRHHYRLAFIEAFRRRGIYPGDIRMLSEESLRYRDQSRRMDPGMQSLLNVIGSFLRDYQKAVLYTKGREEIFDISRQFIGGTDRRKGLHQRIQAKFGKSLAFERLTGLLVEREWQDVGVPAVGDSPGPTYQILNLRVTSRVGPDGSQLNQIVFGLVQRLGVVFKDNQIAGCYAPGKLKPLPDNGFEVFGGCTLIFDLDANVLRYAISKPLLRTDALDEGKHELNRDYIESQRRYQSEGLPLAISQVGRYFGAGVDGAFDEPFALLHNS
jgi:hypothetical protein